MSDMMINAAKMKMWSRMGSRAAFGMTAVELGKENDHLMVLTADVSTSAGLDRYRKTFPDQYLDVGIAEQNMMGVAAGLASEGLDVITATFAPFQTMRCCEQIRVNLGYMKQKVCMVGLASGVVLGSMGYTHCCIEDVAIMRAIPGVTVISPADCGETVKAVQHAVQHDQSVYIRLTGGAPSPIVYADDYEFAIGKAITLREGKDLSFIAAGTMVHHCLEAARILAERGIDAAVVNMHTIDPVDTEAIDKVCETSQLIVTVEEHNTVGGLGSAVAEYKTSLLNAPPQLSLGIKGYSQFSEYKDLLNQFGLTAEQIAETVVSKYEGNQKIYQL